jgi:hypothetical protein
LLGDSVLHVNLHGREDDLELRLLDPVEPGQIRKGPPAITYRQDGPVALSRGKAGLMDGLPLATGGNLLDLQIVQRRLPSPKHPTGLSSTNGL